MNTYNVKYSMQVYRGISTLTVSVYASKARSLKQKIKCNYISFIEVYVPVQESQGSCIYASARCINFASFYILELVRQSDILLCFFIFILFTIVDVLSLFAILRT
jgi:hypothetical protein